MKTLKPSRGPGRNNYFDLSLKFSINHFPLNNYMKDSHIVLERGNIHLEFSIVI